MEFTNNVSIIRGGKNGKNTPYSTPKGLTRDNLINGSFKLIPTLKSLY
jgi:hypothetical protein